MTITTETFAGTLRRYREDRGLRQHQLADRAGVSQTAVCLFELGQRMPSLPTMRRLADALALRPRERRTLIEAAGYRIGERD